MGRVLFVNLTRLCNVDCPRCYLTPEHRAERTMLPEGALRAALSSRFFAEPASDGETPLVIFQGGEHTVIGEAAMRGYIAEVRSVRPEARMAMVSNLLALPAWAVDVAFEHFGGRIETTWAAGMKRTLTGSEDRFQGAFAASLARAVEAGLSCPVNVELNDHTLEAGPRRIIELHQETGATAFEFDISVRFDLFRRKPAFGPGNYPVLPLTINYAAFRDFLLGLRREIRKAGLDGRILSNVLRPLAERHIDKAFNTCREADFITLNPDLTITTNPLFSDITETHLGSLSRMPLDDLVNSPMRLARIAHEHARLSDCAGCRFLDVCEGGPSHAPVFDGSGECAGTRTLLARLFSEEYRLKLPVTGTG